MQLTELLARTRLSAIRDTGPVLRANCPFHDGTRSLWISTSTGRWGCWSERCPRHEGGWLPDLLQALGLSWEEASAESAAVEFFPDDHVPELADEPDRVQWSHVWGWAVDWVKARRVLDSILALPDWQQRMVQGRLQSSIEWEDDVEHRAWMSLAYLLQRRGCRPEVLDQLEIGFAEQHGLLVFPVASSTGVLHGVGWREPADKRPVKLCGCMYPPRHPQYTYVPVTAGDALWGWFQQRAEIADPSRTIVVVEGQIDAIRVRGTGNIAVAKLRSRMTDAQRAQLMSVPNPVIIWPDDDQSGVGMRDAYLDVCLLSHKSQVCFTTDKKDAADLSDAEILRILESPIAALEFISKGPHLFRNFRS